jgi:hypothetical protein
MIRKTLASQPESDLKSLGQPELKHPADGNEAAAAVEVIVEPQTGFVIRSA